MYMYVYRHFSVRNDRATIGTRVKFFRQPATRYTLSNLIILRKHKPLILLWRKKRRNSMKKNDEKSSSFLQSCSRVLKKENLFSSKFQELQGPGLQQLGLCTGLNRCRILWSGQVFLFYFLNRVGNGLSIFAPRPGPGWSGAKKFLPG